jgi:hypothetical protein
MVEKSGVEMVNLEPTSRRHRAMMRCARNIARWWMFELYEHGGGNDDLNYPGETSMQRGLMPLALWLGVREYGGIWEHGGGEGRFGAQETLGSIGDGRLTAMADVMSIYSFNVAAGPVLRPAWYRNRFVQWAEEVVELPELPDIRNHHPLIRSRWCGRVGCPYPFVTQLVVVPGVHMPGQMMISSSSPTHMSIYMMDPRWGAELRTTTERQEEGIEREDEEEGIEDYSPISVE